MMTDIKSGRRRVKEYRKNFMRVSAVEDLLRDIIERVPTNSKAKTIIIEELEHLIHRENEKVINKAVREKVNI